MISFRMDYQLEKELNRWRGLRPNPPSRSRAIRVLLRRALAAEKWRRAPNLSLPTLQGERGASYPRRAARVKVHVSINRLGGTRRGR